MSQVKAVLRTNAFNNLVVKRLLNQSTTPSPPKAPENVMSRVQGLTERCVKKLSGPVGPGAAHDADYKNPEYFSYHKGSYAEAEIEMKKYRIPQPSSKK